MVSLMIRAPFTPILLTTSLVVLTTAAGIAGDKGATEEQARFFETKIRPVLVDQCSKCHGPEKSKAGLRVDSRATLMAGGDTGPAIVPGKPEESLLVTVIRHGEDAPKMPPSKKLPDAAIADLTRWVAMGAPWPADATSAAPTRKKAEVQIGDKERAHWAFQPIRRPGVPAVKDTTWGSGPLDAFILARLESKGLRPNPPASKHELIRRACYDLTGLPPTPEEVKSFEEDRSPTAFETLIDRLLASPRYGEKWGRHWLDLVRFAETNSYERDGVKPNAWRFRDYVIRSLNADKPFDRFAREQIAGDELPDGGPDGLVATGYYRLGIWDDEPSDRDQAYYDSLDDVVATTGQVFLGLTIDCARCHDHKLDPIPQKDYYKLVAFFRNVNHFRNGGPTDEAPLYESAAEKATHELKVAEQTKALAKVDAEISSIEEEFRTKLESQRRESVARADLQDLRYRFYRDTWETLPDFDTLKAESSGALPENQFSLAPRTRDDAFGFVFEGTLVVPKDGDYTFHLDSDDGSRLAIAGKTVVENDGIHGLGHDKSGKVALEAGQIPIRLDYFQRSKGLGLTVGWSGPGFNLRSLSSNVRQTAPPRTVNLARKIMSEGRKVLSEERVAQYKVLRERRGVLQKEVQSPTLALCVTESGREAPETHVLLRGNPQTKGDKVQPGFLQVLGAPEAVIPTPPPGSQTTGRRSVLADWIVSPSNPLPARVLANRVWQYHFGRGIVRSSSNFGLQGDRPTHPELLDWLAAELQGNGWRLKPLHRLIMTSSAYRMSSRADEKALKADPTNDLFWRFDMRRLSAEEIRDSILAVAGNLNLRMYGPGVFPEIPAEVLAGQSIPGNGWGKSTPEESSRRSIYIHVKRSLLYPILESYDVAETDRSSPSRFATTQPTQALAMLNGSFSNQQAEVLATWLRREVGGDRRRQVERALRLVSGRDPLDTELRRGLDLIADLERRGLKPDDALRSFCLVTLNLNEFLYLD
jgi:mono/diheme cytochrome c family protein